MGRKEISQVGQQAGWVATYVIQEVWKCVVGWEGVYEVSDQGRVRSLDRVVSAPSRWGHLVQQRRRGRIMSGHAKSHGYVRVALQHEGAATYAYVHALVLQAFRGARPEGHETRHLNGLRSDNRLLNLDYGTHRDNQMDRVKHGTSNRGERHGLAKLTESAVRAIRGDTAPARDLALRYGCSPSLINNVRRGSSWGHVV